MGGDLFVSGGVQVSPDKLRDQLFGYEQAAKRIANICSTACRCTWRCLGVFVHFYICTINRTHILLQYYKPYFYIVFSVKPSYFDVFLFSFPTFAEKSDILDICFSFLIPYYYPFCQNIIFSFQNLYEFPPCSSSLILSLSLYTIAYNLSIKISVPTPYPADAGTFAFNLILPLYFLKCYNTITNNLSISKGIFLSWTNQQRSGKGSIR